MEKENILRRLPPVTTLLIAANVVVFLTLELFGSTEDSSFMLDHGALFWPAVVIAREYYRLFTAMFLHFGATHLMHNMLMLYLIGSRLEQTVGSLKMLLIYVASGIGANLFTLWYDQWARIAAVSAGASGALMGLVGALFGGILKQRGPLAGMGRRQMLILIGLSLYSGFVTGSTNNAAHISGLLFGFLLGLLLYRPVRGHHSFRGI